MSVSLCPNSYKIDIRSLDKSAGSYENFHRTFPNPTRIGVDLIGVPSGKDITLDVHLQSVEDGVLLTGTVEAVSDGECVRCLGSLSYPVKSSFTELFWYEHKFFSHSKEKKATKGSTHREKISECDEIDEEEMFFIHGDIIDLEQVIIDSIALSLPLAPSCLTGCDVTECNDVFFATDSSAEDPTESDELSTPYDPRFAKLKEFLE